MTKNTLKFWPVTEETEREICAQAGIKIDVDGHKVSVESWRSMHTAAIRAADAPKLVALTEAYKVALQENGFYHDYNNTGEVLIASLENDEYKIEARVKPEDALAGKAPVKLPKVPTAGTQIKGVQESKGAPDPDEKALKTALKELDDLVGLDEIKSRIRDIVAMIRVQQMREKAGLPLVGNSYHMVFTGNPGTGKTTVGRIMGEIFAAMGLLSQGHLIEVDSSDLIDKHVGATALKTDAKVDEAMGGILLIDEAYGLDTADGNSDGFGPEAIAKLLKRMEDDRDNLIVIMTGYTKEMDELLKSNPGLNSRFKTIIEFPDYSDNELLSIYKLMNAKYKLRMSAGTKDKVTASLSLARETEDHFGNGRAVRNLFEEAVIRQARRLSVEKNPSVQKLSTIQPADIPDQIHYRDKHEAVKPE